MANSKVDPRVEDKTQEAIDLYFSQNHKILSPEEALTSTGAAQRAFNRSVLMESVGNSPELSQRKDNSQAEISILEASKLIVDDQNVDNNKKEPAVNEASSVQSKVMATSTQTILSMPPVLPPEVEAVLAKYCNFNQEDVMSTSIGGGAGTARSANSSWRSRGPFSRQQSLSEDANLSNTTLRRKLFDGIINEDESSDKENDDYAEDVKGKENYESTAMIISPGKLILTPKSNRIPSPNKSVRQEKANVFLGYRYISYFSASFLVVLVTQSCVTKQEQSPRQPQNTPGFVDSKQDLGHFIVTSMNFDDFFRP